MELRQIRYFITVAETKSLSSAVEKLHIAQPALSQNIKNLEEELGSQLFTRSHQGMTLTGSGQVFLNHAYAITQQVNKAKEAVLEEEDNPSGSVYLGMTASSANVLSAPLYKAVRAQYPNIDLHLECGLSGDVKNAFLSGAIDLMIGQDINNVQGLVVNRLIEEAFYLVTAYNPEIADGASINFQDLGDHPLFLSGPHHDIAQILQSQALIHQVSLNIMPGAGALQPTLQLIKNGVGCCVQPWSGIYDQVEQKQISAYKIIAPQIDRTVSLTYSTERLNSNACKKVMDSIVQVTKQLHSEQLWRGQLLLE